MYTWDFEAVFTKDQILALPLTSMNNNVIETKHRRKDGSIYPVEVSASAVSFIDGHYIFTISRDTSAQKRLRVILLMRFARLSNLTMQNLYFLRT